MTISEWLRSYNVGAHDGPPLHPVICDEAANEIDRLSNAVLELSEALLEAQKCIARETGRCISLERVSTKQDLLVEYLVLVHLRESSNGISNSDLRERLYRRQDAVREELAKIYLSDEAATPQVRQQEKRWVVKMSWQDGEIPASCQMDETGSLEEAKAKVRSYAEAFGWKSEMGAKFEIGSYDWPHYVTAVPTATPDLAQTTKDQNDFSLRWAAETILETFSKDEAQGYRSRDRHYAISILKKALES